MTCVCLWIPAWSIGAACAEAVPTPDQVMEVLLRVAPRVAMAAPGLWWADGRGLPEQQLAERLCVGIRELGGQDVRAGLASTAVAAEVAARHPARGGGSLPITRVPVGQDRTFLAPYPLDVLQQLADPDPMLLPLLAGLGIETCGDLATLGREEIEVRCGADGVRLWRLARGEDGRRPFGAPIRSLPRASCAWTDYALRDGERLLFVVHRLVERVCEALHGRGEGALELILRFALANRRALERPVRAAHPTADRSLWTRLIRLSLESLRFPDAVTGITVRVRSTAALLDHQGDVFDRGFASARAVDEAIAQLLDTCGTEIVVPTHSAHPLLERRMQWRAEEPAASLSRAPRAPREGRGSTDSRPHLTLQLLPVPRRICVVTDVRRDHEVPVRYDTGVESEGGGHDAPVLIAAGPDRIEGGDWEGTPYARDYFQCVDGEGRLVLLFRAADGWYLHGWWD